MESPIPGKSTAEKRRVEASEALLRAIRNTEESLSEVALLDLRRRRDTMYAIVPALVPLFAASYNATKDVKAQRENRTAMYWFLASLVIGATLHYVGNEYRWAMQFSLGIVVVALGIGGLIQHEQHAEGLQRALREIQFRLNEMLFRWIANGGSADRFWALRDQIDFCADIPEVDDQAYSLNISGAECAS